LSDDPQDDPSAITITELEEAHRQNMAGYLEQLQEKLAAITASPAGLIERCGVTMGVFSFEAPPAIDDVLAVLTDALEQLAKPHSDPLQGNFQMISFARLDYIKDDLFVIVYRVEKTGETGYAIFDELIATCERITPEQLMELVVPSDASLEEQLSSGYTLMKITGVLMHLTE
jgi:hypothetical protein